MIINYQNFAEQLANALFIRGSEPDDKAQRIQFMGGRYPDNETKLGGLGRTALTEFFEVELRHRSPASCSTIGTLSG